MAKGYYIKKDERDGLTLNIKKTEFIQYLQGIQGDWVRFKIYQRDVIASNGLSYNMELIERKMELTSALELKKATSNHPNPNPTNQVD